MTYTKELREFSGFSEEDWDKVMDSIKDKFLEAYEETHA